MKDDQLDRKIQKIKKRYDRKHSSAIVDYLDEALKGRFPVKETEPDLDYCPIALTIDAVILAMYLFLIFIKGGVISS